MKAAGSVQFLGTPGSLALGVVLVAATAVLGYLAWRRSGSRWSIGVLELIRTGLVAVVAAMLNQPEWVESYRPEERPELAVLWDASGSMETRDVVEPGSREAVSRKEAVALWATPSAWDRLGGRFDVTVEPFSVAGTERGTDLYEPLERVVRERPGVRAVVLISDGDWNEGRPPVEAALRLRGRGVPIYAIPVGSRDRLPDLEVLSLDAPTFGVTGKAVRVPFTIESALPRDLVTTVTLRSSAGDEVSKEVRIAAMSRTSDALVWKPPGSGDYTLTLELPQHPDEVLPENNALSVPIAIRDEKLKVLVVESYPRWEYRYLRNALSRDPGVELSCLLFHPDLDRVGGGSTDYIKRFPEGLEELSTYDVVFLGDVGVEPGQLTAEQCRLLRGLVEYQASGLVFLPGWQGRQMTLLETALGDLYPVVVDVSQPGGWGSRTPSHMELTEAGRRSLLTKLADTAEENAAVWEELPGFQWYAPVVRARPGSETLCVHQEVSNEYGRLPLIVTRTFGAGKVLFMGTDGAWRWRKGVEDKYHYRFWGQVVRWMAYQRNMARGETMRFYYAPDQPRLNQTLGLRAHVMERTGEPLIRGDVTARIVSPSGKAEVVRLAPEGEEWGVFVGQYRATEPGKHQVILACKQTGATLETSFNVQGTASEPVGRPARPEVLEELARVTRGQVLGPGKLDELMRSLAELPEPEPSVRRVPLWSHPAVAGGLIALMGIFWVGRKAVGLI
ncbi:MAG: membrane protein [Isosphaeraceae bacterium]|jgi:hypothetical protein|nr:MAG: membrane protein [Isosphaeraceae bacterium]